MKLSEAFKEISDLRMDREPAPAPKAKEEKPKPKAKDKPDKEPDKEPAKEKTVKEEPVSRLYNKTK